MFFLWRYKHIHLTTRNYICSLDSFGDDYKQAKTKAPHLAIGFHPTPLVSSLLCSHFTTAVPPLYDSASPTLRQCYPHFTTVVPPLYDSTAPIPPNGLLLQGSVTPLILYGRYKHAHVQVQTCIW